VDPQGNPLQRLVMSGEGGTFRIEGFGGAALSQIEIDHHAWKPMTLTAVPIPAEEYLITLQENAGFRVRAAAGQGALRVARAIALSGAMRSDALASGQWYFSPTAQESFGGEEEVVLSPRSSGYIQIAVEADGLWDVSAPMNWSPDQPMQEITLTPGHRASLSVRVAGAKPADLRQAVVSLINTSLPEGQATTSFSPKVQPPDSLVFEQLPAGMYLLLATSARGDTITRTNLYIAGGESKKLELPMQPSLFAVRGRVLESDGRKGVAGVPVSIFHGDLPEPPTLDVQTTAKDGSFEFVAVQGGRPLLIEARRDEARARVALQPLSADAADVAVIFPKSVRVQFKLPPRLTQQMSQAPLVPLVITSVVQGEGVSLRGDEVGNTFNMWAGEYVAFWGEDLLGRVMIPEDGGEVELPDLRDRVQ
jgi:hypothetical protein